MNHKGLDIYGAWSTSHAEHKDSQTGNSSDIDQALELAFDSDEAGF
jgi:hypothetical protein